MKNFKNSIFLFFLFLVSGLATGQSLSKYAQISIITCAPGSELYSTFGHSAIRIKDPVLRIDNVYNYGTFNFETPNFYIKFIRGKLDYMLSVSPYRYFIISYKQEKRAINEQILNLSDTQKNNIYKALKINSLPENVYYRYDFIKDNCATRVLKIIKDVLKDSLILPEKSTVSEQSFREMLMPYLQTKDWERFGINLALGRPVDKIAKSEQTAFLPDYLKILFEQSKIKTLNGIVPIVKKENILYLPYKKNIEDSLNITPKYVLWFLLVVILFFTIFEIKYRKKYFILDKTLFFIIGFIGLIILFLWFFTEHSSVVNNQNIIWASPLFFIAAFLLKKNNKKYLRIFFLSYSVLILLFMLADVFFIPIYDKAVIPLELILIVRSSLIYLKK